MLFTVSELSFKHIILSIDADPLAMLLIVHPVPVVLTVRCDLLANAMSLASHPEAIVNVVIALPVRAEGPLAVPHVVKELPVVCHLRCLLIVEASRVALALL